MGEKRFVHRPLKYRRSVVTSYKGYKFDIKGAGLPNNEKPENKPYKTGLLPCHSAIIEWFLSWFN